MTNQRDARRCIWSPPRRQVSVFVLGQEATDAKSNEITAIPLLLQRLELNGALVTIDAMGCQTKIAATILDRGADYLLAVKDNQPSLHMTSNAISTIPPMSVPRLVWRFASSLRFRAEGFFVWRGQEDTRDACISLARTAHIQPASASVMLVCLHRRLTIASYP
jgi:hypothetical protein